MRLALFFLLPSCCFGAAFHAERVFHESLTAYQRGEYQKALEGFMDVLIENPEYPYARQNLNQAAQKLLKLEEESIEKQRKQLMADIEIKASKKGDVFHDPEVLARKKELLFKALQLAKDPDNLELSLGAYIEALRQYPIYHNDGTSFPQMRSDIQNEILRAFPTMAAEWRRKNPGNFNTGALADVLLTEQYYTERWKSNRKGLYVTSEPKNSAEKLNEKIRIAALVEQAENRVENALQKSALAYKKFLAKRFEESSRLWQEVLKADPKNEEASLYLEQALLELKKATPVVAAKPELAAPAASTGSVWAGAGPARRLGGKEPTPEELFPEEKPARRTVPLAYKFPVEKKALAPKAAPAGQSSPNAGRDSGLPAAAPNREISESPVTPDIAAWAQGHYQKGLRAYSTGDLEEAITQWKQCLSLDPSHPKARKAMERAIMEKE